MSSHVPLSDDVPTLTGIRRASLASHPATIAALDAGYRQLLRLADPTAEPLGSPPLLSFLSRPEIIRAVNAQGDIRASEAMMRDRWEPHQTYFADLLEWIRWRSSDLWVVENTATIAASASAATTISDFVRPIADDFLRDFLDNLQAFKIEFLGYALMGQAGLREHSGRLYEQITEAWMPVFRGAIERYGGTLRPGVDLREVIEIVTAVGDGLAVREIVTPTTGAERERRIALLSTAVLSVVYAATHGLENSSPWGP